MSQPVLFVDDLGYPVQIGTEVGFTEEAANLLPSGIGNGTYVLDKMHDDGYTAEIVMIQYDFRNCAISVEPRYTRISPEVRITVKRDQIGCI